MASDLNTHTLHVTHVELYHKLGVIEGKLDSLVGLETRIQNSLKDVDDRLSSLEKWRWFLVGISTTVATATTLILALLEVL